MEYDEMLDDYQKIVHKKIDNLRKLQQSYSFEKSKSLICQGEIDGYIGSLTILNMLMENKDKTNKKENIYG